MKILLTGGGSGGHFYPIIAVAQEIYNVAKEEKLIGAELFFMSDSPYNKSVLFENNIKYVYAPAGKLRRYFSIRNFFDFFKTAFGVIQAFIKVFQIYPDVVFGKGGYASFPALLAAKILNIPVVIHESDSVPGRVNAWAGKFAKRVALSYPDAASYFSKDKIALTGNPVRNEVIYPAKEGAFEFLGLDPSLPVIFVVGGSLGAQKINDAVTEILPTLLKNYQVIHQTGKGNYDEVKSSTDLSLSDNPYKDRYKIFDYLNTLALRMAAGAASIIISRSGSSIFEIAAWGLPSILIPITSSNGDHQRKNAFTYARTGAASVIEENNLTPEILNSEIERIMSDSVVQEKMKSAARSFFTADAGKKIAREIISIALTHES